MKKYVLPLILVMPGSFLLIAGLIKAAIDKPFEMALGLGIIAAGVLAIVGIDKGLDAYFEEKVSKKEPNHELK